MGRMTRLVVVALLAGLALAPTAAGNKVTIISPKIRCSLANCGPLDLRSASHGHAGPSALRHVIAMHHPWTARQIQRRPGFVSMYLNLDDGRTLRVFVFGQRGSLRVELEDGASITPLSFSRPDRQSISIVIPRALLGHPSAYTWTVDTVWHNEEWCGGAGCKDAIPARRPPVHDISPPTIDLRSFPDPTTESSNGFSVNLAFGVSDPFSGVSWWALERRVTTSTGGWSVHSSGFGPFVERSFTINVNQPRSYWLRVVAADGQGNEVTSPTRLVTFPQDDAAGALAAAYSGTWGTADASDLDYHGTLHTSTEAGASFTRSFTGTYVAWIARGGGPGTANVSIDGGPPQLVDLASFSGYHRTAFSASLPAGGHTIAITVVSGTVSVDGLAVR